MQIEKLGGLTLSGWIGLTITLVILCILITAALTFFLARRSFLRQLRDNPPINERMIRTLYSQLGRKPSESQVQAMMRNLRDLK